MKGDIRIKVTDTLGNVTYLVRNAPKPDFLCMSKSETPMALSNIAPEAAELRFKLRDARSAATALAAARQLVYRHMSVELVK